MTGATMLQPTARAAQAVAQSADRRASRPCPRAPLTVPRLIFHNTAPVCDAAFESLLNLSDTLSEGQAHAIAPVLVPVWPALVADDHREP